MKVRIKTGRDELVRSLLRCLDVVVEIPLHLDLCDGTKKSSAQTEREAQPEGNPVIAKNGHEKILDPVLCHSGYHGNLIRSALVHQISYNRKPFAKHTVKRQLVLSIGCCDEKLAQVKGCDKNDIPRPIYLSVSFSD